MDVDDEIEALKVRIAALEDALVRIVNVLRANGLDVPDDI